MVQVSGGVSVNTVGVSGNVDPYECPGNFFDEVVVLTLKPVLPSFVLLVIFKNVLWIRTPLLAVSKCLSLSVVSQVD